MNIVNNGMVTGRISQPPAFFSNRDGSRSCRFNVAASNNYKDRNGERGAQFVPIEAYIPANRRSSVYDYLEKGMLMSVSYEVRNNRWADRDGVIHYDITLRADAVRMLESKAAVEARRQSS